MPTLSERPGLDLSAEEVVALCYHLGTDTPSGWTSLADGQSDHVAALIRQAAVNALRARRLVGGDDLTLEVLPAVRELLAICAEPTVLGRVSHRDRFGTESWIFAGDLDATVAQRALPGRVHRFIPIATTELARCMADVSGLEPGGGLGGGDTIQVSRSEYDRALVAASAGTVGTIPDAFLRGAGRAFLDALGSVVSTASLAVVHSPSDDLTVGGALSWIDCGDAGLWEVPGPRTDSGVSDDPQFGVAEEMIDIRRVTKAMLVEELHSYLPSFAAVVP